MSIDKNKSKGRELIRFIITGLICALIDFIVSYLVLAGLIRINVNQYVANALSIGLGFIVSVVINYLLSTFWVFKNVEDDSKSKKPLFILVFVLLSLIAMFLSIGTMELCALICKNAWNIDILSKADNILDEIIHFSFWGDVAFWLYFVSFVLKTLVGLVWNYFTRKYILYKAPKE